MQKDHCESLLGDAGAVMHPNSSELRLEMDGWILAPVEPTAGGTNRMYISHEGGGRGEGRKEEGKGKGKVTERFGCPNGKLKKMFVPHVCVLERMNLAWI